MTKDLLIKVKERVCVDLRDIQIGMSLFSLMFDIFVAWISSVKTGALGLWLELTSDGSGYLNTGRFTVVGDLPDTTQIPLYWTGSNTMNLVGYPYLTIEYHDPFGPKTVEEALQGVCYNSVETYDPENPPYYLKLLSNNDDMLPGFGYWIEVSCSDIWILENSFPTENLI